MRLRGQQRGRNEHGYAMAALLVAIAVMGVLMSAAIPAWRHQARREKEEELVFRGEQYVRAISLWERRMGPGARPPNFDILVDQRFLRKKYKDPITGDDFLPVYMATLAAQGRGQPGPGGRGRPGGRGLPQGAQEAGGGVQPQQGPQPVAPFGVQAGGGGIIGVRSKSTDASIRIYKGAAYYNQWNFTHAGAAQMPGGVGSPTPGGRGFGRPGMPPGRGRGQPGPLSPGRGFGPPGSGGRGFGSPGRGSGPSGPGIGPGPGPGMRPGPGPEPGGSFAPPAPAPTPPPPGPGGGRGPGS